MAVPTITEINSQILGKISLAGVMKGIGWLIFGIIVICGGFYLWWIWYEKKQWTKRVTRFELISGTYQPTLRDKAKSVKLGRGGFEVLYWKKAKVYRVAFGGRTGKTDYYFFQSPDGYDYNGVLSGQLTVDGKIPVVVTNANMRSNYTALEKQIDSLHGQKASFMDKYGNWVFGFAYIVIIGVFAYLFFRQYQSVTAQMPELVRQMSVLVERVNELVVSTSSRSTGGAFITQ